jgi:AAA domain
MKAGLLSCPATGDWSRDADERQFERIWTRSNDNNDETPDPGPPPHPKPDALGIWDAGDDDYVIAPRGCRRFLSSLVADGGVGKTALRIAQFISLASGHSLTGEHVFIRCKVLVVSLEDDADELRRRVYAVLLRYGLTPADVKGHLFLAAPNGLRLAEIKDGAPAAGALKTLIKRAIEHHKFDVVSLDPFIKSHGFDENSNNAIDFVSTMAAKMAIDHNCAIDLPHHTNKQVSRGPGDPDRSRGASAMNDAARLVYTLTPMTAQEAIQFGLEEADSRSLIRMDSGKVNIAPSSHDATWFRIVGIPLDNGQGIYPAGDNVQTVEPWQPPKTWEGLDSVLLNRVLDDIEAGFPDGSSRYSSGNAATDRAAWKVVLRHTEGKSEAQAKDIIKAWVKSGTLFNEKYEDKTARKAREGLRVNATKAIVGILQ